MNTTEEIVIRKLCEMLDEKDKQLQHEILSRKFTTWKFLGYNEAQLQKMIEFWIEHNPEEKLPLK